MNIITDARSTLTDTLSRQADRVNQNAEKIARVGTQSTAKPEAPVRATEDSVQLSPEARAAQEAGNDVATNTRQEPTADVAVTEQNIASVLVDNIQAETAYKAAAETLKMVDNMEGALLEQIRNREV